MQTDEADKTHAQTLGWSRHWGVKGLLRALPFMILLLSLVVQGALLQRVAAKMVEVDHDPMVSHIISAGHHQDYKDYPRSHWIPASEIQRVWTQVTPWSFETIRDDLGKWDIHPPLYFWLLHAQKMWTGAGFGAALGLHFLLGVGITLLVYSIGRQFIDDRIIAALGASSWAISYGAFRTLVDARQYPLYALLALALLYCLVRILRNEGRASWLLLGGVYASMALGILTHYHFVLVIGVLGLGMLVLAPDTASRKRVLGLVPLVPLAFLPLLLLHPRFLHSLSRQQGGQWQTWSWESAMERLSSLLLGWGDFVGLLYQVRRIEWQFVLIAVLILSLALSRTISRKEWKFLREEERVSFRLVLWYGVTFFFVYAVLYLGMKTPVWAVGGRYYSPFWPILSLTIVGLISRLAYKRTLAVGLCAFLFLMNSRAVSVEVRRQQDIPRTEAARVLSQAKYVVAEYSDIGILPRALSHVPPDARVWISDEKSSPEQLMEQVLAFREPVVFLTRPVKQESPLKWELHRRGVELQQKGVVGENVVSLWLPE